MGTKATRRNNSRENGIIIVLVAVGLLAILALIILVIGSAYLATNRNRFQASVNLAGFAAIEEFINRGGGSQYTTNMRLARNKANAILAQNRLVGVSGALGDLVLSDPNVDPSPPAHPGGVIEFGLWNRNYSGYPTADCVIGGGETCPCGLHPTDYPCFRANDNPAPPDGTFANAVRIRANNQSDNSLLVPIARLFGSDRFTLSATSTLTVVQRCTAFLVDVSRSITEESHSLTGVSRALQSVTPPPPPNLTIAQPAPNGYDFGLMAMRRSETDQANPAFCSSLVSASADQVVWCNLSRPAYQDRGASTDHRKHFQNDYKVVNSPFGPLQIQYYVNPAAGSYIGEPFSRYFLAMNAALRLLLAQASGGDLGVMSVFRGGLNPAFDRWPENSGLTTDNGILIQLTDITNVGTTTGNTPRHPNFADRGWVPLASSDWNISGSNLSLALLSAINDLSSCPATARKAIVLATDGIPSCSHPINFPSGPYGPSLCDGRWATYDQFARPELLTKILPELKARRIALSIIWQGDHIDANFVNRKVDGRFIDYSEAIAAGYGGYGTPAEQSFFDYTNYPTSSPCPVGHADCNSAGTPCYGECTNNANRFAYLNRGLTFEVAGAQVPVYFREANGVLGKLALESGGVACPLLPLCQDGSTTCGGTTCYEPDPDDPTGPDRLKPIYRTENQPQRCAVKRRSKTEQAAYCALKAVADNPYLLVEEGD